MAAVGLHRVLAVGDAAQECKADIEDRDAEDEERHGEGDDGVHLEQACNGERGQDVAQKRRAGVAHEDLRGVHIIRDEAQAGAEERAEDDDDVDLLDHERDHDQRRRGDGRHTDGQPVEAVNEVDGVRDGDDPDDRDRDGQPAEVQIRRLGEDVRVRDELDPAAVPDRDARRGDLHEQLRQRLERHDIVQHAEDHDHDRAEQDALHLPVDLREDEHGEQERQKNGQTAHPGDRHLVHAPVVLRHIDRADLARQRLDQRRRRK